MKPSMRGVNNTPPPTPAKVPMTPMPKERAKRPSNISAPSTIAVTGKRTVKKFIALAVVILDDYSFIHQVHQAAVGYVAVVLLVEMR